MHLFFSVVASLPGLFYNTFRNQIIASVIKIPLFAISRRQIKSTSNNDFLPVLFLHILILFIQIYLAFSIQAQQKPVVVYLSVYFATTKYKQARARINLLMYSNRKFLSQACQKDTMFQQSSQAIRLSYFFAGFASDYSSCAATASSIVANEGSFRS